MKIGTALRDLHASEGDLARALRRLAAEHPEEHEVFHVARDLAGWSEEHVRGVAEAARAYGEELGATAGEAPDQLSPAPASADGLELVRDLRRVAMRAYGVSTEWVMVAQAAQAVRDQDLLTLCDRCHPGTLRQVRWANATIKVLSPQTLTS